MAHDEAGRGDSPGHVHSELERYHAFNQARLKRLHTDLNPKQSAFVHLLPLIFHLNHPRFPGHQTQSAAHGIPHYTPTDASLKAAAPYAGVIDSTDLERSQLDIQGVYLLSRLGTMSTQSERVLCLWIVLRPDIAETSREGLSRSCETLTHSAAELGLTLNYRLLQAVNEGSGERRLLHLEHTKGTELDWFYRYGICLAGRYPLWWTGRDKPAPTDLDRGLLESALDFGTPDERTGEDLIDAMHNAMAQAAEQPLAALVQVLHAELDLLRYPKTAWPCARLRDTVLKSPAPPDSDLLLFQDVETVLKQAKDQSALELIRRAAYVLSGAALSQNSGVVWRRKTIAAYCQLWQWQIEKFQYLDERDNWKLETLQGMTEQLYDALRNAWHSLQEFLKEHPQISAPELPSASAHRLKYLLDPEPDLLPLFNPDLCNDPSEESLCLVPGIDPKSGRIWHLYRGRSAPAAGHYPLLSHPSPMGVIALARLNRVIGEGSQLVSVDKKGAIPLSEIRGLQNEIRSFIAHALDNRQKQRRSLLAINVGVDPIAYLSREGKLITSNRSDALSFGGKRANLVLSIDCLREDDNIYRFQRFRGHKAVLQAMQWICNGHFHKDSLADPEFISFSSQIAPLILQRLRRLYQCFQEHLFSNEQQTGRVVVEIDQRLYYCTTVDGNLHYQTLESLNQLYPLLSGPRTQFTPIICDGSSLTDTPLRNVLEHNRTNTIQCYWQSQGKNSCVYITDECGNLYYEEMPGKDSAALLGRLHPLLEQHKEFPIYHQLLEQEPGGQWYITPYTKPCPKPPSPVHLLVHHADTEQELWEIQGNDIQLQCKADDGDARINVVKALFEAELPTKIGHLSYADELSRPTCQYLQKRLNIEQALLGSFS